ncbi:MAG: cell wall hydrolase [Clostridiales bacterium]|nr:cell wall hydrolase [Clostridiales bacterium]
MKIHLPSTIILSVLLLVFCIQAFALDPRASSGASALGAVPAAASSASNTGVPSQISINGEPLAASAFLHENTLYLTAAPVISALFPEAQITFRDGQFSAAGDGVQVDAVVGNAYFAVNDRYFYAPELVAAEQDLLLLPAEPLAQALGCALTTDPQTSVLDLAQVGQPATAGTYPEEDLYWLSRAIYAESGNQPMKGRIAVGTVILNRVADPAFPNTVREVIFAPRQFSPVDNGTIYLTPDTESVIAAKLCLDGAREAENCLYFNVTSMVSWADRARTLSCTIGDHNFYL